MISFVLTLLEKSCPTVLKSTVHKYLPVLLLPLSIFYSCSQLNYLSNSLLLPALLSPPYIYIHTNPYRAQRLHI